MNYFNYLIINYIEFNTIIKKKNEIKVSLI